LKLQYDEPLSSVAFHFNLRRYNEDGFASTIQSLLVVASTAGVTKAKKTVGEDPKELKQKIIGFIKDDNPEGEKAD
jgi:hypothetical protein